MRRSEPSEVLRAVGPRHTKYSSLNFLGLQHKDFQTKWTGRPTIYKSGPNHLKHAQLRRLRRSISKERSGMPTGDHDH